MKISAAVNEAFGAKLRWHRRSRDISQGELAARVGLSRVTVATIEAGKQNTQLQHVFLFARALDVPISDLVPSIQEVEQRHHAPVDIGSGGIVMSDLFFLQDARELLRQLKDGADEHPLDETTD
ncbi:helix-turn-helix transcriptional regulator [Acidicapsa dinghuensis]|uniref:Helix-turn-helix transcriptional regulator n=1 Tax=Acidicapsa dinghuensis TaxID=2218256 RepID=A0ABW1EIY8_9BACT|nr:helix-turn-helix transcriptional regulator [Acidicapsa dinghuensis]